MDPITQIIVSGLAASSKNIAELLLSISDKSKKSQLEAAKGQLDLGKAQLEAVAKERDDLKLKNGELTTENKQLSERVAHFELTIEWDARLGVLYKKGTEDGPYCQIDQYQLTLQGHVGGNKIWSCPKCGMVAQIPDPELANRFVGAVAVMRQGPNPMADYRG